MRLVSVVRSCVHEFIWVTHEQPADGAHTARLQPPPPFLVLLIFMQYLPISTRCGLCPKIWKLEPQHRPQP